MKKSLIVLILIALLALSGCNSNFKENFREEIEQNYPYVKYQHSYFDLDTSNREIEVLEGYILNQGHSYEWVETDSGYDLILHFESEGTE